MGEPSHTSRRYGSIDHFFHGFWVFIWVAGILAISACAQPARTLNAETQSWSGRIALQVDDRSAQSFSAMFELSGDAQTGNLVLSSPLGNQLAQLDWQNGHAQLRSGSDSRSSDSLNTLLQEATGTSLPVDAMFSWLQGLQTTTAGWQVDLSNIADGRIIARREAPPPQATLRIVLTR